MANANQHVLGEELPLEEENESDYHAEYKKAIEEKRPPICPGCNHPLLKIRKTQYDRIKWTWDSEKNDGFQKDDGGGDADKPYHDCDKCDCEDNPDWDLVDEDVVDY
jgi:hypothetical protein